MEFNSKDEILAIGNKDNLLYQKFKAGDAEVFGAINRFYDRAHPGDADLNGGLPAHIEQAMAKELGVSEPKPTELNAGDRPIAKSEGVEPAEGTPVEFSPEWDFDQQQGEAALKQHLGPYRYVEAMADLQDPQNFTLVIDKFIQTPDDGRFLRELFQKAGNHPAGYRLYHHFIKLAKGEL